MASFQIILKEQVTVDSLQRTCPELLYEKFYKKIFQHQIKDNLLCIMTSVGSSRAGLVVAFTIAHSNSLELLSVKILPEFQHQRLAKTMIQLLEKTTIKKGFNQLTAHYQSNWSGIDVFQKIINKLNWEKPIKKFELYTSKLKSVNEGKGWRRKLPALPSHITLFPWKEISELEKQAIPTLCDSHELAPLQMKEKIAFNSLGVKINNSLA
jgi:hypothetical protein